MSTSLSAVTAQKSSPARGAAQYPPSNDLASKLNKHYQASEFSEAIKLLLFALRQENLLIEKETIFKYLFLLLPHLTIEQLTLVCQFIPRFLEVARNDSSEQSKLAQKLAERFLALASNLPLEQKIEYFIKAQHLIAKAMQMRVVDPTSLKESHYRASKNIITIAWEHLPNSAEFYTIIDRARKTLQADRVKKHVQQLEDLQRLCCDEEDHKMLQKLIYQAIEVANNSPDSFQECFALVFDMAKRSLNVPDLFSTERYHNALQAFRLEFLSLDPKDIRAMQKRYFEAFRTFFKVLIDDMLAIMGPPPCGFDLRAMGSIGREEICPFSDLECLILIAEDTQQVRKYFSLFMKILELQIASFGEHPDAPPIIFTCLDAHQRKGFYFDENPGMQDVWIATPVKMAHLQKTLNQEEGPYSIKHMMLRTCSLYLYATDLSLYQTFQEEMQRVIDSCAEDPLKKRALVHIPIRQQTYQKKWQTPFSSAVEKIELKAQFIEPLFHLLGDLALYHHIKATNTLDIIDALGDRFNPASQTLLKEAVSFLYALRIEVQKSYSEQQEDIYFPPHQTLQRHFVANQSTIDSLEKIFYLVIFPLYHIPQLTSIQSLDLVDVAMTQVIADSFYTQNPKLLIPLVRQAARFLERIHAPPDRHTHYYRQIGEIPKGESLRQEYIDNLQDPSLQASLAKRPNSAGFRQERHLREDALFASIQASTTPYSVEGMQVQVTAPCFTGSRYLLPAAAEQIIDRQGRISSRYESKHRVAPLVWQEHKLHFKMWPSHPLMEYALFDLYYRIAGQMSPANVLARFTVTQDGKPFHYPVLISETIDHPTLSKRAAEGATFSNVDVKQWSWLILCAILTRTGDGRLSNYVMSDDGKIYAIDNDIAFVFPTQESLLFSKINFASALFFLTQNPPQLDPEVLEEFLSLDFDLILVSWLENVIAKEKEYNSLFNAEGHPVVIEVPSADLQVPDKDFFTSSILFSPGAIVSCRLQVARLKSAILRAKESHFPLSCFDLLKEFISLRTDLPLETKVGERVFRAYTTAQKLPTVATRYAAAIGSKTPSSLTLAEFQRASFQTPPSRQEIEASAFSAIEAHKELLTVMQEDGKIDYTTSSATGHVTLQGHFAHLRSATGPHLMRQELVLKYVAHLAQSSEVKPTCVILRDCDVLNRSTLLPFLHSNVKIIDLRNSPQILSRSLVLIAHQCQQLEELYLCRANIGAFPPTMTFSMVPFAELRVMQITESPRLTSLHIVAPRLETLDISNNPQLETLRFSARFFPKIAFNNSPLIPWLNFRELNKMLIAARGLDNGVEFYRKIFRNLIGEDHESIPEGDDSTYFEAVAKQGPSLFETSKKLVGTTRQQLMDAASVLHKRLIERLAVVFFPDLPFVEREWLYVCAYLYPDSIPTYFLDEWLASKHPEAKVPEKRESILASLSTDQPFLRHDSSMRTCTISRRFQEIIKVEDRHSSYAKACHLLIRLWNQIDFDDIRNWQEISLKAEELLVHSELLMDDPQFSTLPSEDQATLYSNLGKIKYLQGNYQEALKQHEQALTIRQKSPDPNPSITATSLSSIGFCLYEQAKYQEALEIHQRALSLRQKSLDPNHPHIAISLSCIGLCLYEQAKYQEALEIHQRALSLRQQSLDPNHPHIAISLSCIGLCLYEQAKYQEALEIHQRALSIRQKSLDPNHPDIAISLSCIGLCLYEQAKYQEALEIHQRALEIRQTSQDPNHPHIAISLSCIGLCLYEQAKYQEALEIHQRALTIRQKSLDSNHPHIAISLSCIGLCLYEQAKYQEALEIHQRALTIRQKSLVPDHPDTAFYLQGIGFCLLEQAKYQEALEIHQRALTLRQKSLDPSHPHIAISLSGIGLCLYEQAKYQEALKIHQRALTIRQKSLVPDHPDIASSLQKIGLCLYKQRKYQEALERFQEALVIKQKTLHSNHPSIAHSLNGFGACLLEQGKCQEALKKLQEALVIWQKTLHSNHPDIAIGLNNIGCCLYDQRKYQEALEYYQRALDIRQKSLNSNHPDIAQNLSNIRLCHRALGQG